MSAQDQARALMMRHHHLIRNRQQSMLNRAASEMGLDGTEYLDYIQDIQGKVNPSFRSTYDRSSATMS
ncbi:MULTISPECIES: hypothetical protein [Chroococcaceae]|jgi:hypothetical protein|uniref:Uncharacterized protein n=1 Tax=Chroogloeocystis siderophila 5.2 s.c.1 TaxID=247279 RepID=A0A1U7HVJ2_9CHRO|nr:MULTISPECIES: hypothetical protein [Chroococcaceae]AFZ30406.1 hypothetical protein Glo7428_1857 [Gloeocapsa sp. PCC 7428]OKH27614.1 hypothetical protein NIES1031_06715 [Chroogloeocystis siderophila 5.2 s.c.1]